MADLATTDVAVNVSPGDREIAGGGAGKNLTLAAITFGDGAKTYPTNGIPLPVIGKFGFRKVINFVVIMLPPGDGLVYKYDKTNHSIRVYTQGVKTGATAAATNENGALVKNSAGVEAVVRLPHTAPSTTYDMGQMIELPAATALAATTLNMLIVGE